MSDTETLERYRYILPITTRWMDNDVYGHINNVTYYSYFDTVANHYLIHEGGLDIHGGAVIGAGGRVTLHLPRAARLSGPARGGPARRQARQPLGDVRPRHLQGGRAQAAAHGHFVHVFVDRHTRKAVAMPERLRAALERLVTSYTATPTP